MLILDGTLEGEKKHCIDFFKNFSFYSVIFYHYAVN